MVAWKNTPQSSAPVTELALHSEVRCVHWSPSKHQLEVGAVRVRQQLGPAKRLPLRLHDKITGEWDM